MSVSQRVAAGRAFVALLAAALVVLLGGPALAATTTTNSTGNITWQGNGSDKADPGCKPGQSPYWHWILTPGGGNQLVSGTLKVAYESGATTTTEGTFRNGNNAGALHFDVTLNKPDVVKSASAEFTYNGSGGNFVLTISDSSCKGEPTPPPPPPPVTPEGKLSVSSTCEKITVDVSGVKPEGATVVITDNGKPVSEGTYDATVGTHEIKLTINGKVVDTKSVTVEECQSTDSPSASAEVQKCKTGQTGRDVIVTAHIPADYGTGSVIAKLNNSIPSKSASVLDGTRDVTVTFNNVPAGTYSPDVRFYADDEAGSVSANLYKGGPLVVEKCGDTPPPPPPVCKTYNTVTVTDTAITVKDTAATNWLVLYNADDPGHQTIIQKVQVGDDCEATIPVPPATCKAHDYQWDLTNQEPPARLDVDTTGDGIADIPGYIKGDIITVAGNSSLCEEYKNPAVDAMSDSCVKAGDTSGVITGNVTNPNSIDDTATITIDNKSVTVPVPAKSKVPFTLSGFEPGTYKGEVTLNTAKTSTEFTVTVKECILKPTGSLSSYCEVLDGVNSGWTIVNLTVNNKASNVPAPFLLTEVIDDGEQTVYDDFDDVAAGEDVTYYGYYGPEFGDHVKLALISDEATLANYEFDTATCVPATPPPPPPVDKTCPAGTKWFDKDHDGKVDKGECMTPVKHNPKPVHHTPAPVKHVTPTRPSEVSSDGVGGSSPLVPAGFVLLLVMGAGLMIQRKPGRHSA